MATRAPFFILTAVLYAGCSGEPIRQPLADTGPASLDATPDVGSLADAGASDAEAEDAAPDAGFSLCEAYCSAVATRGIAQVRDNLLNEDGEASQCEVEPPTLTECATWCETRGASEECLTCETAGNGGCTNFCRGTSVRDAQYIIAEGLACWFGNTRPTDTCITDGDSAVSAGATEIDGQRGQIVYTGTVSVVSSVPLQVRLSDGVLIELNHDGSSFSTIQGTTLQAELSLFCSFWCTGRFILRDLTGRLLLAGWSGQQPPVLPELDLNYAAGNCVGSRQGDYARGLELDLLDGTTRIRPGEYVDNAGLRIHNGRSLRLYVVWVTDTPSSWTTGLVERL